MAERFYEVRAAQSADKDIQALPSEIQKRIEDAIQELASNPFPSGCKKLQGERNRFRVRVGKYRIIYSVTYRRLKPTACPCAMMIARNVVHTQPHNPYLESALTICVINYRAKSVEGFCRWKVLSNWALRK
jgi:mRNA interferase RelE/StbE